MILHGVDSLEFLRKQAMYSIICSLHSPSWSRGKEPRSGGEVLNPTLIDGGRPKDMGVGTLAAGLQNERQYWTHQKLPSSMVKILALQGTYKCANVLQSPGSYKIPTAMPN